MGWKGAYQEGHFEACIQQRGVICQVLGSTWEIDTRIKLEGWLGVPIAVSGRIRPNSISPLGLYLVMGTGTVPWVGSVEKGKG